MKKWHDQRMKSLMFKEHSDMWCEWHSNHAGKKNLQPRVLNLDWETVGFASKWEVCKMRWTHLITNMCCWCANQPCYKLGLAARVWDIRDVQVRKGQVGQSSWQFLESLASKPRCLVSGLEAFWCGFDWKGQSIVWRITRTKKDLMCTESNETCF